MFFAYVHVFVFFFKQNDAYEVRIRDWSSDVCSSDLDGQHLEHDAPSYAEPGSGQFKDEDDEGDGVECIAGPGHGVGEEQPPELAGASHEIEHAILTLAPAAVSARRRRRSGRRRWRRSTRAHWRTVEDTSGVRAPVSP